MNWSALLHNQEDTATIPSLTPYLIILGIFLVVVPIIATISQPKIMQASDYLMNFYVAGKLVLSGSASQLYPARGDSSFLNTAFNSYAHSLLPFLPPGHVSIYMYSPLIAVLFAPLALLAPQPSMVAWQALSVLAFLAAAGCIARATEQSVTNALKHGLFYLPVFHTILIGHLGLVFGLLPLAGGYLFLAKKRPLMGGAVWSLLLLKPQFLPSALLMAGASMLNRRYRCLLGLVSGAMLLCALTLFCLTLATSLQWIDTLKLSDTIFSDPHYRYPVYLVVSLPAVLLHLFPVAVRNSVKLPAYLLAAAIGLHALWVSWNLMKRYCRNDDSRCLHLVLLLGIAVLPMVLPHFLFYDLSVFALFGMIVHCSAWTAAEAKMLRRCHLLYLFTMNVYMLLFLFTNRELSQPLLLVAVMAILYVLLLRLALARLQVVAEEPLA